MLDLLAMLDRDRHAVTVPRSLRLSFTGSHEVTRHAIVSAALPPSPRSRAGHEHGLAIGVSVRLPLTGSTSSAGGSDDDR